jgi:DNA-binding Lrp family transcriptional regulator
MDRLDDLDRLILTCLSENARASFHEVGTRVGLSAPAVKRRVDRLRSSGVIRGFTAVIDARAAGQSAEALVEIFCRGRTSPAQLRELAAQHPEARAAWTVSGEGDAMLHIQAADMSELERVLERIREHPSVERTRSVIVLNRLLDRYGATASAEGAGTGGSTTDA